MSTQKNVLLLQSLSYLVGISVAGGVYWMLRPKTSLYERRLVPWNGDAKCIGSAVDFHLRGVRPGCAKTPTVLAVLTRLHGFGVENSATLCGTDEYVPLCEKHLREAQKIDASWMKDEPRDWRNYLFPRSSQNTFRYPTIDYPSNASK